LSNNQQINTKNNSEITQKPVSVAHSPLMAFFIMMRNAFVLAWKFLVALTFIFTISLMVFPGDSIDTNIQFLSWIEPVELRTSWKVLMLVMIFNVTDTIGRFLGGQRWATIPDTVVIIGAYGRAIFLLTFTLIAFNVAPSALFGDNADWFKIINMMLFAFTNGFFSTQCAVKGIT
jgi:hypothetical protein